MSDQTDAVLRVLRMMIEDEVRAEFVAKAQAEESRRELETNSLLRAAREEIDQQVSLIRQLREQMADAAELEEARETMREVRHQLAVATGYAGFNGPLPTVQEMVTQLATDRDNMLHAVDTRDSDYAKLRDDMNSRISIIQGGMNRLKESLAQRDRTIADQEDRIESLRAAKDRLDESLRATQGTLRKETEDHRRTHAALTNANQSAAHWRKLAEAATEATPAG